MPNSGRGNHTPTEPQAEKAGEQITIDSREVPVSNLDKVLYPGNGFTKVIDYYARVSRFLLPHLRNWPVTLKRYPDGVFRPTMMDSVALRFLARAAIGAPLQSRL